MTIRGKTIGIAKRVLVSLTASILAVVMIEVGLALFAPVPFASEVNLYYVPDPHTGYRMKSDSRGSYGNVPAQTNSLGYRDDEFTREKREGVFRILTIGDSFTAGAGARREDAYPQVLE